MRREQRLVVVRGLVAGERESFARALATALPGPVAHIAGEDIGRRWIVSGLGNQRAEVETVYRLLRLATIAYLKDGFSVVVDAAFAAQIDGMLEMRSQDIRDLTRLAHSFRGIDTGVVTLDPDDATSDVLVRAHMSDTIDGEVRLGAGTVTA